jgi:hypothetical protein
MRQILPLHSPIPANDTTGQTDRTAGTHITAQGRRPPGMNDRPAVQPPDKTACSPVWPDSRPRAPGGHVIHLDQETIDGFLRGGARDRGREVGPSGVARRGRCSRGPSCCP